VRQAILGLCLTWCISGCGAGQAARQPSLGEPPEIGQLAPETAGEDLDGRHFRLGDYRGKVVLLSFWGHW
jgi:hypothetical protein